jgi:hypothetical protein
VIRNQDVSEVSEVSEVPGFNNAKYLVAGFMDDSYQLSELRNAEKI